MGLQINISTALSSLRVNKLRAGLTMLGVIIGVAAVIAMVAIGQGAKDRVSKQIESMGSNLFLILPGASTSGGLRAATGSRTTLTLDDAEAIRREVPAVSNVAPTVRGSAQVVAGNQNWSTILMGVTPSFLEVREWGIIKGEAFSETEVRGSAKAALIGKTVKENLFGDEDPIGQIIRIKNVPFIVNGVLSEKGQSSMGQDQDDVVIVPITTAQKKLFGITHVTGMLVKASAPAQVKEAVDDTSRLLRQRHRLAPRQEDDFTIRNLTEMFSLQESTSKTMMLLLGSIASISLIVGGIGIMNIMLVSVTERTKEIGIRRAIGATRKDIQSQFLTEAVILSLTGGIIGILLGSSVAILLPYIVEWETRISLLAILGAFGFSAATGIFFGLYPARKASSVHPIVALKYE